MKVDNPDLDKQALIRLLQTAYGVNVTYLEFVPKGEESYSYVAKTKEGRFYFVKIHLASVSPELEASYRFVHHLRIDEGCEWALSPYLTNEGRCLGTLGNYAVALFDFVSGVSRAPSELSGWQVAQFVGLITHLHRSVTLTLSNELPKESFEISFNSWLVDLVNAVEQPLQTKHAWSQMAYDLMRAEKSQILSALALVEEIAPALQTAATQQAVTHGDLGLLSQNIIQDDHGNLFLIDWSKLCIAPAVRDLVALWGEGNSSLLSAYFEVAGVSLSLFKQTLTYYLYHDLLATITDYGSWLILEDASQAEAEHAWVCLTQALPLDVQKLQRKVEAIYAIALKTHKANENHGH